MNGTTIRANITAVETALTAVLAAPGPNYSVSGPEGSRTISKSSYISELIKAREDLWRLLVAIEPYVVTTRQVM